MGLDTTIFNDTKIQATCSICAAKGLASSFVAITYEDKPKNWGKYELLCSMCYKWLLAISERYIQDQARQLMSIMGEDQSQLLEQGYYYA